MHTEFVTHPAVRIAATRAVALLALALLGASACGDEDKRTVVSSVDELNEAVAGGAPLVVLRAGRYQLTRQLVLRDTELRAAGDGEVIVDVGEMPVADDIPYRDCQGGAVGSPFIAKSAIVLAGEVTIEGLRFVGLNYPVEGYITETSEPCERGDGERRMVIRNSVFEAAPELFTVFSVSVGNTNACGACDARAHTVLERNTFSGSLWGVFVVNDVSDAGASIEATLVDNSVSGQVTGLVVAGSAAGDGGVVDLSSTGNTFKEGLFGAVLIGGANPIGNGIGAANGAVRWRTTRDRFERNTVGVAVLGARFHNDLGASDPPTTGPCTGNVAEVDFIEPTFQGNLLHDAEFFASSTEEEGSEPVDSPIGWPANQMLRGELGPGNRVELRSFATPRFEDGRGRVIFRHHNNNFCIFEKYMSALDADGDSCPNIADDFLPHPPRTSDFGNRVHIHATRSDFMRQHPDLDETPDESHFD